MDLDLQIFSMKSSLDRANFLVSLVGFNIGVEIGQILVLLIMWFIVSFFMEEYWLNTCKR